MAKKQGCQTQIYEIVVSIDIYGLIGISSV